MSRWHVFAEDLQGVNSLGTYLTRERAEQVAQVMQRSAPAHLAFKIEEVFVSQCRACEGVGMGWLSARTQFRCPGHVATPPKPADLRTATYERVLDAADTAAALRGLDIQSADEMIRWFLVSVPTLWERLARDDFP